MVFLISQYLYNTLHPYHLSSHDIFWSLRDSFNLFSSLAFSFLPSVVSSHFFISLISPLFFIPPDSDLSHLFFQLTHLISSSFFLAAYFLFPVHEHRVRLFHVPVLQGGSIELCWGQKGNAIDSCRDKVRVENLKIRSCISILCLEYGQGVLHKCTTPTFF